MAITEEEILTKLEALIKSDEVVKWRFGKVIELCDDSDAELRKFFHRALSAGIWCKEANLWLMLSGILALSDGAVDDLVLVKKEGIPTLVLATEKATKTVYKQRMIEYGDLVFPPESEQTDKMS